MKRTLIVVAAIAGLFLVVFGPLWALDLAVDRTTAVTIWGLYCAILIVAASLTVWKPRAQH